MELNIYRRLWVSWNQNGQVHPPSNINHHSVTHMFVHDYIKAAFLFRFVVRLYALIEEDGKKFTFGYWLSSLKTSPKIEQVKNKYNALINSEDYKKLMKKRHTMFAHNGLKPTTENHSYSALFQISRDLESFYDEIVSDGQANQIPWTGELDPRIAHVSNCRGGIEENVNQFFKRLED